MKQFGVILAAMLFAVSSAFADGTKQFMPNAGTDEDNPTPKGITYLSIAAQEGGNGPSRPFARYNHTGRATTLGATDDASCEEPHRLHIRIIDPEHEKIHFGFGEKTVSGTLKFRIKDPAGRIVFAERDVPTSGTGYIGSGHDGASYKKAYFGPKSVDSRGYDYLELDPEMDGDYYIEFDNGSNIGSTTRNTAISLKLFDITVVKDGKAENGRVWSRAWGLNTNGTNNETYTTFYTMSTDHYLSKVYMGGFQPYQFVIACNSYGSINTKNCEEDRKSLYTTDVPFNQIPEYQVFLTKPDPSYWGTAKIPNVPDKLTFAGDAMTCEDLIFVVQLLYNENATLELYLDTNDDGIGDKVIAALLEAKAIENRGFHYPWKDRTQLQDTCSTCDTSWHGEGIGWGKYFYNPAAEGCARRYTLSLFDQSYSYEYIATALDHSTYTDIDRVNPGDSLRTIPTVTGVEGSLPGFSLTYPIGTEQNPVLITSASELIDLASAVSSGGNYSQCIENFFHYWEGGTEKTAKYCYNISQDTGSNAGFRNTYFYITAPTGTITLDNTWQGIGSKDHPFRGHIRSGRYMPNPATDNVNETTALHAGDQDTITINGSIGLFAYCDGATIENIHVKGTITADDVFNMSKFDDSNLDDLAGLPSEDLITVGGICNYAINTVFSHCTNKCQIVGADVHIAGGILGTGTNCIIDSCANYAKVDVGEGMFAGGIAGYLRDKDSVNFCYNVANIIANGRSAGGIVGLVINNLTDDTQITNSLNEGYAYGGFYSGGIVGETKGYCLVEFCSNQGTISADFLGAGGICPAANSSLEVNYCYNMGEIDGPTSNSWEIAYNRRATHSVSVNSAGKYYINNACTTLTDAHKRTLVTDTNSPFYVDGVDDEDYSGDLKMSNIECCGRVFRQEDAGRLFNSNTTFYIKWDGKNSEGDCVTGDVTVSYQKNSGVTHFPFYDPENNKEQGLVVYRLSPIQDSILNARPLVESGSYANKYGYQRLPKNYFQESNYDETEMGIELKLFWDDTKLSTGSSCTREIANGYLFGESATTPATYKEYHAFTSKKDAQKNCLNGAYSSTTSGWTRYYICENLKAGGKSSYKLKVQTSSGSSACLGISNLGSSSVWDKEPNASKADRLGGYYGSQAGGHLFPIENFGNKNIMNTWWNGVEVKQLVPLKLYENEPAVLMPIELTMWTATSLEESVLLEWTTASEENNDYFAIERSIDGVTWKILGNVGGAGTTSATHYYSFEDTKPVSGISYYRLKQVDFNGEYTYSSVKCINRPANADKMYKAYVNKDIDAFIVQGEEIAACNIEVYNNLGVKMTNLSFNPISTDKVVINVGQLPVGTYFIKICNGSKSVVKSW